MPAKPGCATWEESPFEVKAICGIAPNVSRGVGHPALGAVVGFRNIAARDRLRTDPIHEWFIAGCKSEGCASHVDEWNIDVNLVVAAPLRRIIGVPCALETTWQRAWPARRDQEIAPDIEGQDFQTNIARVASRVALPAFIRRNGIQSANGCLER